MGVAGEERGAIMQSGQKQAAFGSTHPLTHSLARRDQSGNSEQLQLFKLKFDDQLTANHGHAAVAAPAI